MPSAYIVECVRTPTGKNKGGLSHWHPSDLGAVVIDELVSRTGIDPAVIDDVIFGCVSQVGSQSGNIGRGAVLASKLPESVPGTTVDRQCGSSQQAVHFAAQAVMSGTQDVVIAGGVESMSGVPIGASIIDGYKSGHGKPSGPGIEARYPGINFSQFEGAEMLAAKFDISREDMDRFAVISHQRAADATEKGYFNREIVALEGKAKDGTTYTHVKDEGIRPGTTLDKLRALKPLKKDCGRLTAATSSQISDGAAAVLICNEDGLKKLGLRPRAKIAGMAVCGSDPVMMLYGPVPATRMLLERTGIDINDVDLYEVNEAFASVPLAWVKEIGADFNKLNVNGGAQALGHPLGATGAKLCTTLVHELERRGAKYGIQAICEGGGTANAMLIERIGPSAKL